MSLYIVTYTEGDADPFVFDGTPQQLNQYLVDLHGGGTCAITRAITGWLEIYWGDDLGYNFEIQATPIDQIQTSKESTPFYDEAEDYEETRIY